MEGGMMDLDELKFLKLLDSTDADVVTRKKSRKRPLPQRMVYTEEARLKRLEFLSTQAGAQLSELQSMRLGERELRGNIESLIGAVEIPVGIAGPLLIHGSGFDEEIYAPLATTEGALVSSVNRGSRALSMSGGVCVRVLKQRMVRAPLFDCGRLQDCLKLKNWIQSRWGEIQRRVREYSNHAVLIELDFRIVAPCLHVRFVYETGDASGQNMTTLCTWNISQWILDGFQRDHPGGIRNFIIDGNLSTDKKASLLSAIEGRGREVVAEAFLSTEVILRMFNTTPAAMARYFAQSHSTGVLTGIHGLNVNVANVIAAIFTATGQDIASVHESSTAQVYFEEREGGLYMSLLLPCLVVGSVGGGVSIGAQKQLLEMMGAYGPGKANRLAEIIGSFALALELSTGAALTSGNFAEAHERLGRKKQNWWLKKSDLDTTFFNHLLSRECQTAGAVIGVREESSENCGESLVMNLTSQISERPCGLWRYDLQFASESQSRSVFLKVKVPDEELLLAQEILASMSSPGLGELLRENRSDSLFKHSHIRELKLAELNDPELRSISPRTLGCLSNEVRGIYILAQEFLQDLNLFEAVERREAWNRTYLDAAIRSIAQVHGRFLGQTAEFESVDWMIIPDKKRLERLLEPHFELALHLHRQSMEWFTEEDLKFHEQSLRLFPRFWEETAYMPRTLIHNDFNPRNLAFRSDLKLVVYDWELATVGLPQRDLAEFLCFTLSANVGREELMELIELHRRSVEERSGMALDSQTWIRGFEIALLDLILQRFPIYSIAQMLRKMPFLQPSYKVARRLLSLLRRSER